MPEEKKSNPVLIWGTVVVIIAVIAYGAMKYTKKEEVADPMQNPATEENPTAPAPTPILNQTKYKNGTYASDGMYISPAGDEKINVSLVLADDIIVDATVKSLTLNPTSKKMQEAFIGGFKAQVVGKKLDEVNLTKVSSSSLTPKGWNDAVAKIQLQAKA